MVGRLVDEYLVVKTLGAGGFGKVFLVLQQPIMLKAALKLVHGHLSGGAMADRLLEKFHGEARALAQLTHPNIVRLLKFGVHQSSPYMVMEYVEGGRTLRDEMTDWALSGSHLRPAEGLRVLRQLTDGLGAAHKRGLLHRDVKPENIMLQRVEGNPLFVRILDFGLAKDLTVSNDTSVAMGTPAYMAPEQIRRRDLGPWTDWYAVGVIAFELLTGQRPFGDAAGDTLFRIKLDPHYAPAAALEPGTPVEVVEFLQTATAHDPETRFRNASDFRAGLERAGRALGVGNAVEVVDAGNADSGHAPGLRGTVDVGGRTQPTPVPSALSGPASEGPGALDDTRERLAQERARLEAERARLEEQRRSISGLGPTQGAVGTDPTLGGDGPVSAPSWKLALVGGAALLVVLAIGAWLASDPAPGPDPLAVNEADVPARVVRDGSSGGDEGPTGADGVTHGETEASDPAAVADASAAPDAPMETTVATLIKDGRSEPDPAYDPALPPPTRPDAEATQPPERPISVADSESMVTIPAGRYPVGCQEGEKRCWPDERPGHDVKLSAFSIMAYEVTVGAYFQCVDSGACRKPAKSRGCPKPSVTPTTAPMTCVAWEDARTFCRRRGMRLPTEHEWEVAARGKAHHDYPWGDTKASCAKAALKGCGVGLVGQRPTDRSWAGVFDMGGSAREWTDSAHLPYPGSTKKPPRSKRRIPKVTRGSSVAIRAKDAHTMRARLTQRPADREADLGFRCAKSP